MVENDEVTRVQAQVQTRQTGKRRNMKSRLKEGVPGAKEDYLFFSHSEKALEERGIIVCRILTGLE